MFVCVLCLPRVEAGKNTSTVIPASRKRRRKGNPVETVMYGYEPSATLTTDRLHYKLQTRPLVRESPCGGGREDFHRNPCESHEATEREPSSLRPLHSVSVCSVWFSQ
jgi:hypothetical protein